MQAGGDMQRVRPGNPNSRPAQVVDGNQGAYALNELEWVDGEVWANVWNTDCIARINPTTGAVK